MPIQPARPCRHAGCPELVAMPKRYCPSHASEENTNDVLRRGGSAERGYTDHWRKVRMATLRAHPVCSIPACGHAATEVHHLDGNPRNNHPDNLQALCKSCHSSIRDRGESGYRGAR